MQSITTKKWFERKFDFKVSNDDHAVVNNRLQQTIKKIQHLLAGIPNDLLVYKPQGKWSIKENTGHLAVLEPLWRERIIQIQTGEAVLAPADLENKATFDAGFNDLNILTILKKFIDERSRTLLLLNSVNEEDKTKSSLHPRLNQPMRIIDLAYFVAELVWENASPDLPELIATGKAPQYPVDF